MVLLNTLRFLFIGLAFLAGVFMKSQLEVGLWFPFAVGLLAAAFVSIEVIFRTQFRQKLVAVFFGLIVGLLLTSVLFGLVKLIIPATLYNETIIIYLPLIALLICYLSVTIIVQTKDELRLIIPYVDFQNRGGQGAAVVVDTSALIDGRLVDLTRVRMMPNRMIIPRFVLLELQALSDSADSIKRMRGRRGLDNAALLQASPDVVVSIDDMDFPEIAEVDQKLVSLAKRRSSLLITTDSNLTKVAHVQDIVVINIHEVAQLVKPPVVPGEIMQLRVAKKGDHREQGVGFLEDGTMVVIEDARDYIGMDVMCEIEKVSQSPVGRIVFARKVVEGEKGKFSVGQEHSSDSQHTARGSRRAHRSSRMRKRQDSDSSRRSGTSRRSKSESSKSSPPDDPPEISADEMQRAQSAENTKKSDKSSAASNHRSST